MTNNGQIVERLEQEDIRLWPYYRDLYPRDILYQLWRIMDLEQGARFIFYHQQLKPEEENLRGDLVAFVRMFDPVFGGERVLLVAQSVDNDEIMGFCWFDGIIVGLRANYGLFFRRRYWGEQCRQASKMALNYAFENFDLLSIDARTPWKIALKHGLAIGFKHVATFPNSVLIDGKPKEMYVLRCDRG